MSAGGPESLPQWFRAARSDATRRRARARRLVAEREDAQVRRESGQQSVPVPGRGLADDDRARPGPLPVQATHRADRQAAGPGRIRVDARGHRAASATPFACGSQRGSRRRLDSPAFTSVFERVPAIECGAEVADVAREDRRDLARRRRPASMPTRSVRA